MMDNLTAWSAEANAELDAMKKQARLLANAAVKDGTLHKPNECPRCGSKKKIEAHHPDYCQPLLVEWLCQRCHRAYHARLNHEAAHQLGFPDVSMVKKSRKKREATNE